MLRRGDVNADRARKLVVDVEAENAGIRHVVVWIGESPRRAGRDRAFAQIAFVTQAEDRFAVFVRYREPAIDTVEQFGDAVGEAGLWLGRIGE